MRCPAGQASLARYSGGAGAPPGSTKRPCQELADDRKAQAKRLRSLLPRRASSARMEGVGNGARIVGGALIGESAARRSACQAHRGLLDRLLRDGPSAPLRMGGAPKSAIPPPSNNNGPPSSGSHTKWPPNGPRSSMVSPTCATSWKKGETSPSSSRSMASSMLAGFSGADAME